MDTTHQASFGIPQVQRRTAVNSTLMLLFLGDIVVIALACHLAFFVRFTGLNGENWSQTLVILHSYRWHLILAVASCAGLMYFRQCYGINHLARFRYGAIQMLSCAFIWSLVFLFVSLFLELSPQISRVWVGLCGIFTGLLLACWRYTFCRYLIAQGLLQSIRRKTLVVGWNCQAQNFYERSQAADNGGNFFPFRVRSCATLATNSSERQVDHPSDIYRGDSYAAIEKQLQSGRHDTLIVANTDLPQSDLLHLQEICGREMVDFMIMPDFIQTLAACLRVETFAGLPLLTQNQRAVSKHSSVLLKRGFDIAGALFGLIVFAPLIAFFAWRVYRESPGPVFYRQIRIGQEGHPFEIIKIRSMRLDAEKESGARWCQEDDPRRLSIGSFMRRYNIDELPQFWNVLRGEMSLVGPRPERPELIKDFKHDISFYNIRHLVKPGITGWAQVNGWRGDTCLESRIACDLEYIERWNVWLDIFICLKTLRSNKNAY